MIAPVQEYIFYDAQTKMFKPGNADDLPTSTKSDQNPCISFVATD